MSAPRTIRVERKGVVARVTLCRAERFNAFDDVMVSEMEEAFVSVFAEPDVGAVVITGEGSAFCAGGDVRYMRDCVAANRIDDAMKLVHGGSRIVKAIHDSPVPVIAAVNGAAVGGGASLAFACDIRLLSEKARFHLAYARLGLAPGWGGAYFIPRLIGPSKCTELLWRGASVGAEEAVRIGLAGSISPPNELLGEASALAAELAGRSRRSISYIKKMAWASAGGEDLDAMLAREEEAQRELFSSEEVRRSLERMVGRLDGEEE